MITGKVMGGREVVLHLKTTLPEGIAQRVATAVDRLSLELLTKVKAQKLSGQVLKNRTGTLRRSINRAMQQGDGKIQASVGTNIAYAKVHEFGFHGTEQVKAHLRMMKVAFGREVMNPRQIEVKAFTRQVNLPERSFLRSALREMESQIKEQISLAVKGGVRES